MTAPLKIALIGGGVIGAGWAARFIEHGHDVAIYDPHPEAPRRVAEVLANARSAWAKLTIAPRPRPGRVTFAASIAEAVLDAALVQESGPEREDLKQDILASVDAHAPADALIGSSTSGLRPSRLQARMQRPERFFVAHPFNPVYLLPLVELCGGARTSPETIDRAAAVYTSVGMKPLHVRKEIDGFIADRLLEALWREALWLVHDDIATTEDVDDAIRYGAGLRWAMMGTFLVYRIAGGEDGMRHFMSQFGPALKWPWTKLTDVPELTDAFLDKLAAQSDAQARGLSIRDLERTRDDGLVAILQALKTQGYAAGQLLASHEARLYDELAPPKSESPDPSLPLLLLKTAVQPEWVDYNNHMTEARYLQVFADATDAFLIHAGMDEEYRRRAGSYFTVETHIRHLAEARGFEQITVHTQVLAAGPKKLHLFHRLMRDGSDDLLATGEHLLVHVDAVARSSAPVQEPVASRISKLAEAHAGLPPPDGAGRRVGERQ